PGHGGGPDRQRVPGRHPYQRANPDLSAPPAGHPGYDRVCRALDHQTDRWHVRNPVSDDSGCHWMSLVELTGAEITSLLGRLWWPFLRIGGLLWAMPLFGDQLTIVRIRILLALALAAFMAPMLPSMPSVDPLSLSALVLALEQVLLGLFLGLMLHMLFSIMSLLGQILSLQMGLAMGIMNDPSNGQAVPLMGQMLIVLATFLFFIFDGHLVALDIVVESFFTWPPGSTIYALDLPRLISLFGWVFGGALLLAIPAVIAM